MMEKLRMFRIESEDIERWRRRAASSG